MGNDGKCPSFVEWGCTLSRTINQIYLIVWQHGVPEDCTRSWWQIEDKIKSLGPLGGLACLGLDTAILTPVPGCAVCLGGVMVNVCVCVCVCMSVGEFHINWRHLWGFSPTNWRHTYQPATSPVFKKLHFVARIGCVLEFPGHIGLRIGLGLALVFGCMLPTLIWWYISMYICLCV